MSGQLGRPYGAEKPSFYFKGNIKTQQCVIVAGVNPVCICYSPGTGLSISTLQGDVKTVLAEPPQCFLLPHTLFLHTDV